MSQLFSQQPPIQPLPRPEVSPVIIQDNYEVTNGNTVKVNSDFMIKPGVVLPDELVIPARIIPRVHTSNEHGFIGVSQGEVKEEDVPMKVYAKWGEDLERPVWLVGRADERNGRLFSYYPKGELLAQYAPPEDRSRMTESFLVPVQRKKTDRSQGREFGVDYHQPSGRYSVTQPKKVTGDSDPDRPAKTLAASERWMYSDAEWAEHTRTPVVLNKSSVRRKLGVVVAAATFGLTGLGMAKTEALGALNYNGVQDPIELGTAELSGEQDALRTANESINAWLTGGSEQMRARADYQEFKKDRAELYNKIDAAKDAEELNGIATEELGIGYMTIESSIDIGRQKDMLKAFSDAYRVIIPKSDSKDQLDGLRFAVHCNISNERTAGQFSARGNSEVICLGAEGPDVEQTAFHELAHWIDYKANYDMSNTMARLSSEWGEYKGAGFDHRAYDMTDMDREYFEREYSMTDQDEDLATSQERYGENSYVAGRDALPKPRQDKFDEILAMTEATYPGYADRLVQTLEVQGDSSEPLLKTKDFIALTIGLGGVITTARRVLLDKTRKKRGIAI